jgi:hypothetical protein
MSTSVAFSCARSIELINTVIADKQTFFI